MDVVSTIQSSMEILKKLRDLSSTLQDADFRMLIADLSNSLADAKLEAASVKEELAAQKELVRQLTDKLDQKVAARPDFHDDSYWFKGEMGNFCTGCWDARNMKIRLKEERGPGQAFGRWYCPNCKNHFG